MPVELPSPIVFIVANVVNPISVVYNSAAGKNHDIRVVREWPVHSLFSRNRVHFATLPNHRPSMNRPRRATEIPEEPKRASQKSRIRSWNHRFESTIRMSLYFREDFHGLGAEYDPRENPLISKERTAIPRAGMKSKCANQHRLGHEGSTASAKSCETPAAPGNVHHDASGNLDSEVSRSVSRREGGLPCGNDSDRKLHQGANSVFFPCGDHAFGKDLQRINSATKAIRIVHSSFYCHVECTCWIACGSTTVGTRPLNHSRSRMDGSRRCPVAIE